MARDVQAPDAPIGPLQEVARVYGLLVVVNPYDQTFDLKDMGVDQYGEPCLSDRGTGATVLRIRTRVYNELFYGSYETPDMIGKKPKEKLWIYFGEQVHARMLEAEKRGLPKPRPRSDDGVPFDKRAMDQGGEIGVVDLRDPVPAVDPISALPTGSESASAASPLLAPGGSPNTVEPPREPDRREPPPSFGRSKRAP